MSKIHKTILEKANEAISNGDFEGFLAHCTDDTVWNFLGDRTLRGKEAVRQWMVQTYKNPPRFKVRLMIAEGHFVASLGEITLSDATGKEVNHAYCDVWRFEGDRMAELNAYVIGPD